MIAVLLGGPKDRTVMHVPDGRTVLYLPGAAPLDLSAHAPDDTRVTIADYHMSLAPLSDLLPDGVEVYTHPWMPRGVVNGRLSAWAFDLLHDKIRQA